MENKKATIKFEDIIFWLIIIGMISIALWLLHGSPTETGAIIGIITFAGSSELLLWKKLFSIDKHTAVGFERIKGELKNINYKFNIIDNKLNNIENLIKKK
ncbi:MAG: hypothetical protein WC438_03715 [Candidatus Pacearchaeota archaeon]